MKMKRVRHITNVPPPLFPEVSLSSWITQGIWRASWISGAAGRQDLPVAYRRTLYLTNAETIRIHVSAAACYRLWLDGVQIALGPELGDLGNTFFDTWEIDFTAGEHILVAAVLSFGHQGPCCLMEQSHGFLLAADEKFSALLDTGIAEWEALPLPGFQWIKPELDFFNYMGISQHCDNNLHPAAFYCGSGEGWRRAEVIAPAVTGGLINEFRPQPLLRSGILPERHIGPVPPGRICCVDHLEGNFFPADSAPEVIEQRKWEKFLAGTPLTVPPYSHIRILIELDQYYCFHYELETAGGRCAEIRLSYAEALFLENRQDGDKGNRAEWRGRWFIGIQDRFIPDGNVGNLFFNHWRRAGRFLLLTVTTVQDPLNLMRLALTESRYPFTRKGGFHSNSKRINKLMNIGFRTLELCAHDTYMDCPYYEQLMYLGDARIQALVAYTLSNDARLTEKSLRLIAAARLPDGLLPSRYPSDRCQIIPGFALVWVGMLLDYVMWHGADRTAHELLPVARGVIDAFLLQRCSNQLVPYFRTWNFMDWAHEWSQNGVPLADAEGFSAGLNAQLMLALRELTDLCDALGEPEAAKGYYRHLQELHTAFEAKFWNEEYGLFSDAAGTTVFSEHTQSLAILSGALPPERLIRLKHTLTHTPRIIRATFYFSHYLFEAYRVLGETKQLHSKWKEWFKMMDMNLKTFAERPEPSRSDCHAWSSHPCWHMVATVAGIRPAAAGFGRVRITPEPGALSYFHAIVPHPQGGTIQVIFRDGNFIVTLPKGIPGEFSYHGQTRTLTPGKTLSIEGNNTVPAF